MDASHSRPTDSTRFYLSTLRYSLSATALLNDPRLCALAAEDVAWRAALSDWRGREPKPWRRRRVRAWNAEHQELLADLDRLRALARSLGLPIVAGL